MMLWSLCAGILSKAKGEVLQICAIFRAMNLVLDNSYPENLSDPAAFLIHEGDVRQAWNFVNLTTRQRIAFENDRQVTKICSEVLGWKHYRADEDEDEDNFSDEDAGGDELVRALSYI